MRGVLTAFCLSLCALASGTEYKLKLAPAAPLSQQLYRNSSLSSWGGNVLHAGDEGDIYAYHLFAAGFTNGCGLSGWESNSFVLHAVSQSPVGPFEFHDVALPVWHHNPQAIRAPDGTWLIYSIGRTNTSWAVPCNDKHEPVSHNEHQIDRVEIHYSKTPYGPWKLWRPTPDPFDGSIVAKGANPSPLFLPNGSVVVVGTGFGGPLKVAYADTWKGPYREVSDLPFAVPAGNDFEDPGIWFDAKAQKFKLLMHQYHSSMSLVGGYAESKTSDFFGEWEYDFNAPGYNATVSFTDGTTQTFQRRERPKVLQNIDGEAVLLYNGVCDTNTNSDCFTFVQRIEGASMD